MDMLSNAFSVLEFAPIDDDDDQDRSHSTSANGEDKGSSESTDKSEKRDNLCIDQKAEKGTEKEMLVPASVNSSDKSEKKGNLSSDQKVENARGKEKLVPTSTDYRLPLVWIDLEMTGLNVEVDRILEIACIITDGTLNKLVEGPDLVVHQSQECLDGMNEWCQTHHADSGLTRLVTESTVTEGEAEKQVIAFVKGHIGTYMPHLAGNSVYMDFIFLKKYMPKLASMFSHVVVDVSSVRALCLRWYPRERRNSPDKEKRHRAMDDIRESIMELKYYKENIFKPPKSKK